MTEATTKPNPNCKSDRTTDTATNYDSVLCAKMDDDHRRTTEKFATRDRACDFQLCSFSK